MLRQPFSAGCGAPRARAASSQLSPARLGQSALRRHLCVRAAQHKSASPATIDRRQEQAAPSSSSSDSSSPEGGAAAAPLTRGITRLLPVAALRQLRASQRWLDERVDARLRGLILLNIMTLLMGSNCVVVKQAGSAVDPAVFSALRFTLAAAAFTPFLGAGLSNPATRKAGVELGVWSAAGYLTQAMALGLTDASRASLLGAFTVLAVPVMAGLSGEKIKPLVWVCGAMALVGTGLLEAGGGSPPNAGDALAVLSALCFALQLFRTEGLSRSFGGKDMLPLLAVSMLTTAAASGAGAAAIHWNDFAQYAAQLGALFEGASVNGEGAPVWQLAYTAWCSTDLALLVEVLALQSVTSTEAAMVYSVEPISGAALAYVVLGERWGPTGWLGAGVILAASMVTQLNGAMSGDAAENEAASSAASLDGEDAPRATERVGTYSTRPVAARLLAGTVAGTVSSRSSK